MKRKLSFGKIDLYGTGKRYLAEVEIELKERGGEPTFTIENGVKVPTGKTTPTYTEFTACGTVWNTRHTDCVCGGQCLDEISKFVKTADFKKIYTWWKKYHLNGMNAGTPEQEQAIKEWKDAGNKYDYDAVCEMLKEKGLYEVPFTGKSTGKEWHGEIYRYGSAWIVSDIPEADLCEIKAFIENVA